MKFVQTLSLVLFTALGIHSASAQLKYRDYTWEDNPTCHTVPDSVKALNDVSLRDLYALEYVFTNDGNFLQVSTTHVIVKLNTSQGVEANNRIYLDVDADAGVWIQKARVITPDNRVIEMTEDQIKTAVDEETGNERRYFALEGLVPGCDLEYIQQLVELADYKGGRLSFQGDADEYNMVRELRYPKSLDFLTVQRNFDQAPIIDTLENSVGKRWEFDHVKGLPSEPQANMRKHLMHLEYKLESVDAGASSNVVNFAEFTASFYQRFMQAPDKDGMKAVTKLVNEMKLPKGLGTAEKTYAAVAWMRKNVAYIDARAEVLTDLQSVVKNRQANNQGTLRLYTAVFRALEIPFELAVTQERDRAIFDPDFESYYYLNSALIYFPETRQYLDHSDLFSVPGIVDDSYTYQYALFVKEKLVAGLPTGIGKVQFIEGPEMAKNKDVMHITAEFNDTMDGLTLGYDKESYGVYAKVYQPIFSFLDAEASRELRKEMVKWTGGDLEIVNNEFANEGIENLGVKPLVHKYSVTTEDFLTSAGTRVLFEIGKLIGPQAELYMETERTLPVDAGYKHMYERSIRFTIPAGYQIKNLDDLNLNVVPDVEGKRPIGFVSKYTVEGNTVVVTIDEYYDEVFFSAVDYDKYRAVINAAADFNKIVLVLEKV